MRYIIWISCSTLLLAACGGGGSNTTTEPAQYPLDTAISAFYQMSSSYNLKASSGGNSFGLDLKLTPGAQGSFHGTQAMTATLAVSETENGSAIGSGSQTLYFLTGPYKDIGANLSIGVVLVDSGQKDLPDLAKSGTSGSLDSQKYYSDSSLATQIATGTRTWSLNAVTEQTALFCIEDADDLGGSPESEADCYLIDTKGNVLALQVTEISGGTTLVFK